MHDVPGDFWRRLQGDRVPHDPDLRFVDAVGPQEVSDHVRTIDLKPVVRAAVLRGVRLNPGQRRSSE
jgi:hypothetical protein